MTPCPTCHKPAIRHERIGNFDWYVHEESIPETGPASWAMCVDLRSAKKNRQSDLGLEAA